MYFEPAMEMSPELFGQVFAFRRCVARSLRSPSARPFSHAREVFCALALSLAVAAAAAAAWKETPARACVAET